MLSRPSAVSTLDAGVKAATPVVEEGIKIATPYVQEAGDALGKVASRFARDSLRDVLKALDDVVVD